MHHVFERDFDQETALERQKEERALRALHTAEELDELVAAARAEAFADGCAQGHAAGVSETNATLLATQADALNALSQRLGTLISDADQHHRALEGQILDFALSASEQIFPELLRDRARERAAQQVLDVLHLALGSAKLRVHLSERTAPELAPMIEAAAQAKGISAQVELRPDPNLAEGDARVEWDNGFMEYSYTGVCDRILKAMRQSKSKLVETSLSESEASV